MSASTDATAAGAGGGAVKGAAAGSKVMPGVGTVVGGVIGGVLGGVSGYMSQKGAAKRKRAQKEAQARYQGALERYRAGQNAAEEQRQAHLVSQSALANDQFNSYLGGMPGDQTAALNADYNNQQSALMNAGTVQPALSGPLGGQYAQEMRGRVQTAINPMAYEYAAGQQTNAFTENGRKYQMGMSALSNSDANYNQLASYLHSGRESDMNQASAAHGINRTKADKAGGEQMLYGQMANSALDMGAKAASAYGGGGKPA